MAVKVPQQESHEKIATLIKTFADGLRTQAGSRAELVRIFGDGWTDALEAVLTEKRVICERCKCDQGETSDMADAHHCLACARELRREGSCSVS